jgi:hypothetical protein
VFVASKHFQLIIIYGVSHYTGHYAFPMNIRLCVTTLSIMILNRTIPIIKTFIKKILCITINKTRQSTEWQSIVILCHLCLVSFMLIGIYKPFMLSVTIVTAHILSVIMLSAGAINTFKRANNSVH